MPKPMHNISRILSVFSLRTRARSLIRLRLFNLFLSDMQISTDAFQMEQAEATNLHDLFAILLLF